MEELKNQDEFVESKKEMHKKYSRLIQIIFVIGMLVVLWTGIVFSGILFGGYAYGWAGLNLDTWLLVASIIISVLIILELALYFRYNDIEGKKIEIEKPKPEFMNGKKVHAFTYPKGVEGGVFSKTYVEMDDHNVLRLRALMVHPGELWGSKEEQKDAEI